MTASAYDKRFYDGQIQGSLNSARLYLEFLLARWMPRSVIDVGCGRGAWLTVCRELGAERVVGLDGPWVNQGMMLDPAIEFRDADLAGNAAIDGKYDLALSLEVAEHLPPAASDNFVSNLVRASDAVLFSAAFVAQPGTNHINTRPHSFWAEKFLSRGYLLFDIFRAEFWDNDGVDPWYRQNTFLYVKPGHPLHDDLVAQGRRPCQHVGFVDCIHPWLYSLVLNQLIKQAPSARQSADLAPVLRANRNELCPCGSGKKYKHCHGKLA